MIDTKELHIGYNDTLLQVEDMQLASGNVYILIGKNGSGKSTFLKTLSKQLDPKKGSCLIDNKTLSDIDHEDLPKQIAFVSSKLDETEYLRVKDYVGLARSPYTNYFGKLNENDLGIVNKSIQLVGVESLADRFITELSDGEKQLVAIAKSIAQETPVILLDEPTAFLDYTNKMRIMNCLIQVAQEQKKCIIISSHDLDISLDSECPFLVIDKNDGALKLLGRISDKATLINVAY